MTTWNNLKLSDLVDIIDGDRGTNYPKQDELFNHGYCLFLSTRNVPEYKFSFDECSFISEDKDSRLRKGKLQRGDYVFTTRGTVGNFAHFSKNILYENIRINSGMVILRVKKTSMYENYLQYLLQSPLFKDKIKGRSTGSAQPQLPIRDMHSIEVSVPSVKLQSQIASILSTYDDLIENNEKRIQILEEMAQRLYMEWFVNFKFPEYEKVKMVDSGTELGKIPEEWSVNPLDIIVDIVAGFSFKSSTYVKQGKFKIVTIKNVHDNKFIDNFDSFIDELPEKLPKSCLLANGDILLSLTGNVGRVCVVTGYDYLLNQRVAKLIPRKAENKEYIYQIFRLSIFQKKLESISNGAAQQNLSPIQLKALMIIKPTEKILNLFHQISAPIFNEIMLLNERNINLQKMRDLLIPQLVSGKRELK